MLGWSRPRRTSISPQTLLSLPLTFFFGMTFSATSIVSSLLLPFFDLPDTEREDEVRVTGGLGEEGVDEPSVGSAAAPLRATRVCSGGTCHVACYF